VGGKDQRGITRPQGAHCDIGAFEARFTLTGISPASGGTAGGNRVTLTGSGFGTVANTQVLFDGEALPAGSIVSVTATQIVFTALAHEVRSVSVTVSVNGTALAGSVTYMYAKVAPQPGTKPGARSVGAPSAVPGARPAGPSGGTTPDSLPPSR
jgi:hypothetical protein